MSILRKADRPAVQPRSTARRQVERPPSPKPAPAQKELYRVACEDADGNRYTVIVREKLRLFGSTRIVNYSLEDGAPVLFVDDQFFEIGGTGKLLRRCD